MPPKGSHHTEEAKRKIGLASLNRDTGWFGRHHTQESKEKIRQSALQRPPKSEETRQKISQAMRGERHPLFGGPGTFLNKKHSEATKMRMSLAALGRVVSNESRQKMAKAKAGTYLGDKNPNWRGGLSNEPYPLRFNRKFKQLIRLRDGLVCQICGVPQDECLRKLNVHHIDHDKNNIMPINLISLCNRCHGIVETQDSGYWQSYLEQKNAKIYAQGGGD